MLIPVVDFGPNPGALDMYEHVPAELPSDRPIVVVLHGCTQQASAMEAAGWNALADEHQFTVVYAQQRAANQALSCFTWFADGDIARDSGEAKSVMQMVDHAIAAHRSDRSRVYVTGLSAGGAFTAVMLAAYPDRFAAGSIIAGIPYRCATDVASAQACGQMGAATQKTPAQWGDLVRAENPGFGGRYPRLQIFHGTSDYTVAAANATELVDQWTNVWGTDVTADATDTFGAATRSQFIADGKLAVELYMISSMGHSVPVGEDGSGPCPARTGAFFSDVKLCSTVRAAAFFGLTPGSEQDDGPMQPDDDDDSTAAPGGCTAGGEPSLWTLFAGLALGLRRRKRA